MTLMQYTAEVKDSLTLELPIEAEHLHLKPGDKVQIQLDTDENMPQVSPNEGMLAALSEIADRQNGRRQTDCSNTDRMLREGRGGAMWGCDPLDPAARLDA